MPIDPTKSTALLIGTSQFPSDPETLTPLEEVVHNLNDLERLLRDEQVAGFKDVRVALDKSTSTIGDEIDSVASDTQGTLLIYYAGHGVVRKGQFYLTGKDSIERSIWSSGIKFEDFRDAINHSPAHRKVIILDACFSGRAIQGMASDAGVIDANVDEIQGAYTITSASGNQAAPAKSVSGRHTGFTDILLQVIEHGITDRGEWISVENLYNAVRQLARETKDMPDPRRKYSDDIAGFELFKNRARVQPDEFVSRTEFAELSKKVDTLDRTVSVNSDKLSKRLTDAEKKLEELSKRIEPWPPKEEEEGNGEEEDSRLSGFQLMRLKTNMVGLFALLVALLAADSSLSPPLVFVTMVFFAAVVMMAIASEFYKENHSNFLRSAIRLFDFFFGRLPPGQIGRLAATWLVLFSAIFLFLLIA